MKSEISKFWYVFSAFSFVCILSFMEFSSILRFKKSAALSGKGYSKTRSDRYLISSELSYGRFSNIKVSIAEVLGLSLALNRTAVLPKLDPCFTGGNIKQNDDAYFDQLFDVSAFSRVSVVSSSGLDLVRICGEEAVAVEVMEVKNSLTSPLGNKTMLYDCRDLDSNPLRFGDDVPPEAIFDSYPYSMYFLPRLADNGGMILLKDRLLPDKLALLENFKCLILGRNYLSLNWARLPLEFEEIQRELIPNPSIRKDVRDFFGKNNLIGTDGSIVPFLGIHLRMGDFLKWDEFKSFGYACNNEPELLVQHITNSRNRFSDFTGFPTIVLATDDYQSNCAIRIQQEFHVIVLNGASIFHHQSCRGAIFDQEVLGSSSFFFGDEKSTFSQSIHQIRTIRNLYAIDTTFWLSGT